jgi:hypothetical protein
MSDLIAIMSENMQIQDPKVTVKRTVNSIDEIQDSH